MNRLNSMLQIDKNYVPEEVVILLKSELKKLLKEFFNLKNDVRIRFISHDEIKFFIEFEVDRVRSLGYVSK